MNSNVKISILHLISSNSFLGAERVVCELVKHSDASRFLCAVALLGSPVSVIDIFKEQLRLYNVRVVDFPCASRMSWKAIRGIADYVEDNKVDIIHSHGYKSNFYSLMARRYCKKTKAITTNHNWIKNTLKEKIYYYIDIQILKRYTKIAAVSQEIKANMISAGIKSNNISFVLNGISASESNISNPCERKKIGISERCFVVGCVASLIPVKAHSDLICAFARLLDSVPDSMLVLVGDGPQHAFLDLMARQLGIKDRVVFLGYRNDARELMYAFNVFVLVSYSEGLPMAMLEAMAASLPVVVSSVGAIPQVITHMKNGILVTPGNVTEIFNAFATLADDPDLRKTLGRNARKQVMANYSVERMAKDYEELYDKVLGSGK